MKRTLHLNLKRKWFDMILLGKKKEEYRDITDYWEKRLIITDVIYETIIFSNGYSKNRDQFEIELKRIRIGKGKEEWGAEKNKDYYILELGDIVKVNIKKI